jgi:predicted SAM-dependent methyltransferase
MYFAESYAGTTTEKLGTLGFTCVLGSVRETATRGQRFAGRGFRRVKRLFADPRRVHAYLATHDVRKLQIGTGAQPLSGWLNTDLLPDTYPQHRNTIVLLDATRHLPFEDETFDYILSEHQIEHISEPAARLMLRECFRVLRPGGRIRVATPDLEAIVGLLRNPLGNDERHYVDWIMERFRPDTHLGNRRCHVINHMFKDHQHQFIYDFETLAALLADAGFADIQRKPPGESDDPELRGVEGHGRTIDDERVNTFETFVAEAVRPAS